MINISFHLFYFILFYYITLQSVKIRIVKSNKFDSKFVRDNMVKRNMEYDKSNGYNHLQNTLETINPAEGASKYSWKSSAQLYVAVKRIGYFAQGEINGNDYYHSENMIYIRQLFLDIASDWECA